MATIKYTYAEIMVMDEKTFNALATSSGNKEWLKEAATRTEIRKTYPRMAVWNEEKGKNVYIADKSKKPKTKTAPISFLSLKKAYCVEVLKIQKKSAAKKETFRDRIAAL